MSGENQNVFSNRTTLAIILVGVFTFSSFIVLSAYAPTLRAGTDGGPHALSKGATGYAFLAQLLKQSDIETIAPRSDIPDTTDGVLVYTPRSYDAFENAAPLNPYQITIIIAPKWTVSPDPFHQGWVRKNDTKPLNPLTFEMNGKPYSVRFARDTGEKTVSVMAADAYGAVVLNSFDKRDIGKIDRLQYLPQDEAIEPMIAGADGKTLIGKLKDAPVYIVADPDLANTHGLASETRARLASEFFAYARVGGPVVFDLSLHGIERTRNIIRLVLEPPLLAATLCLFFATLLLSLKAAARFGPARRPDRPFEAGKSALADNSSALIRMANREIAYGGRYADLMRKRIAKAIGAPKGAKNETVDALIHKLGGDDHDFAALSARIKTAANTAELVAAARNIYQYKKEIMREPR